MHDDPPAGLQRAKALPRQKPTLLRGPVMEDHPIEVKIGGRERVRPEIAPVVERRSCSPYWTANSCATSHTAGASNTTARRWGQRRRAPIQCAPEPPPTSSMTRCGARSTMSGQARAGAILSPCIHRVKPRACSARQPLALKGSSAPAKGPCGASVSTACLREAGDQTEYDPSIPSKAPPKYVGLSSSR